MLALFHVERITPKQKSGNSTFAMLAMLALFHIKQKIIKNILKKVLTRCNTVLLCAYSVALQCY